jgi:hypothetical protein
MNKEQVLSMPAGRELDALIAEKVMERDVSFHKRGGAFTRSWIDGYGCEDTFYSTDIATAWRVVDKMCKSFWIASLVADTNLWRVTFYTHTHRKTHEAIDESAPLAICRAALLAVFENTSPHEGRWKTLGDMFPHL